MQRRNAIGNSVRNTGGDEATLPPYTDLLWPTVQAVIELGGSGVIEEIDCAVISRTGLSEAAQAVLHGDGPGTEIEYRLAWARTYLKGMGLLSNTRRGVWSVTDRGRAVRESEIKPMQVAYTAEKRRKRMVRNVSQGAQVVPLAAAPEDPELWREPVLGAVADLSEDGFERLATAVLRAAGFTTLTIPAPGGSHAPEGAGHVEGTGVLRVSLLSFSVFFRFLRAPEKAGADVVREFRAAMVGRGEKGLLVATGSFTEDARAEAHRHGAPPIDLVDGDGLCDLLKEHGLGVRSTVRTVEDVSLVPAFFAELSGR
ncbi:restriction endonuclease [Rhodococcus pyridinivorans SB3094]|uniref:Restriction endonuclease n=1 Tax=Rhodococcus pyridinivorans SB3094 TaxID=1435356 RepID=V9XIC8_9NOCA|nr:MULTISPECIES: winged helix-turn-helix domain-containing protein [Rhodococcus]AHD23221.1 restriction endonuclease [Rhodococcus pyridinivorans SB3094]MCT7291806.1 restriction endonuclease [Rhodococcus sp. PAE-6]